MKNFFSAKFGNNEGYSRRIVYTLIGILSYLCDVVMFGIRHIRLSRKLMFNSLFYVRPHIILTMFSCHFSPHNNFHCIEWAWVQNDILSKRDLASRLKVEKNCNKNFHIIPSTNVFRYFKTTF